MEAQLNWITAIPAWCLRTIRERRPTSSFKPFVGDDLDAEAGQALVVVRGGREVDDRAHAEIPQDLRADADFSPLPVAIGLGRLRLAKGRNGNTGGAVAQIHQHAAAGLL